MKHDEIERVVGAIELFKLRHGHYPDSLGALELHNELPYNTALFAYARLDTGYALDYSDTAWSKFNFDTTIALPPVFWKGLGCRRSNLMEERDSTIVPGS
jgi:hypothetical protein